MRWIILALLALLPQLAWAQAPPTPVYEKGRAENAEPTAAPNGTSVAKALDVTGRTIVLPYVPKELMLRDKLTAASTTATSSVFTAVAGIKNYIVSAQCYRTDTGTTLTTGVLNDSAATNIPLPPSAGAAPIFVVPLVTAANTALTLTSTVSNVVCNLQGFQAQ